MNTTIIIIAVLADICTIIGFAVSMVNRSNRSR